MADRILHKRSLTPGSVPTTSSLEIGEIALNVNDGKLFLRQSGSVEKIVNVGESASYAATASYVQNAQTASYVLNAVSSSYALTASYVAGASSFPYTGSAQITGLLGVTGSLTATQIGAGAAPSSSIRLDVRASSSAATDIAFRVRNSADNDNLIEVAGNGLIKFRTGTERIEIGTTTSDYKISAYKFGVEMTRISTYSSYFCYGSSGQYLGIGTNAPSHLLDIYSLTPILTRWTNDENNLAGSDVTLKFTTRYTGGSQGGNPMAYLTVGGTGAGVNSNNRSYFKFLLSKQNTLAERASITSQANFLLQTPTEDVNDIGVIYIPNGTAPTSSIVSGYKQYSANRNAIAGKASPHFRTEDGTIVWLGDESRLFNVTASNISASLLTATQIGAGAAPSGSVRLDVRASSSAATDIAFRVRNSADTQTYFTVRGDQAIEMIRENPATNGGILITKGDAYNSPNIKFYNVFGLLGEIDAPNNTVRFSNLRSGTTTGNGYMGIVNPSSQDRFLKFVDVFGNERISLGGNNYDSGGGISFTLKTTTNTGANYIYFSGNADTNKFVISDQANVGIGSTTFGTSATNTLAIATGSIPSSTISSSFQLYASTGSLSANVRPHFRTGNGTIVWLGDESRLFNVTASNITASNITASSLTIPSGSITITTGSITMPNRPAFRVTGAGGAKVAVTTLSGSYLNVDYQQGSGWDNSTGTFTAPIAGLYQVNLVTRTNSNSLGTISQLIVYKNNTGGVTGTPQIMVEFGANTTMNHAGGSTISKLAVGDTLKMVVAVGEISFDANDNFSVAYIG